MNSHTFAEKLLDKFRLGAVCSGWCLPVCPRWITSHIATYIFLFGFPAFYAPFQQGKPVIR